MDRKNTCIITSEYVVFVICSHPVGGPILNTVRFRLVIVF